MATTPDLRKSELSTSPDVSIILPVLNEANHLAAAVSAILSQDYQGKFEVILAIGPSKDATLEIAQELANQDSRVVLVDNPTGKTAAGLNLALGKSQSPIIVRVDGHAEECQRLQCGEDATNHEPVARRTDVVVVVTSAQDAGDKRKSHNDVEPLLDDFTVHSG